MENRMNINWSDFRPSPQHQSNIDNEEKVVDLTETFTPPPSTWNHDHISNNSDYMDRNLNRNFSTNSNSEFIPNPIGNVIHSSIQGEVYEIIGDYGVVCKEFETLPLNLIENDIYDFSPQSNTAIGNLIKSLVHVFSSRNLKIQSCNILKTEKTLSLFDNYNGDKNFILPLITNLSNDKLTLDLLSTQDTPLYNSALNKGILNILEGSIPYKLTRLNLQESVLCIVGDLIKIK